MTRYPADVQSALDHAAEVGWSIEKYQAVLAIALTHLDAEATSSNPEVVVMLAEGDISCTTEQCGGFARSELILDGELYLVCPVCCVGGTFDFFQEGVEYASAWLQDDMLGDHVTMGRDSYDFSAEGDWGLSHQSNSCFARLSFPDWLTFDD